MININMIAERRARKIREMTILRVSTLVVIVVTVLMILWNVTAYFMQVTAKNQLVDINDQLKKQKPRYEEWVQLQNQIGERQPVVTLLEQVQKSEGVWMIMLADVEKVISPDIVVNRMGTEEQDKRVYLRIEGRANSIKTVGNFMLALSTRTLWAEKPELKGTSAEVSTDASQKKQYVRFIIMVPIRGLMGGNI